MLLWPLLRALALSGPVGLAARWSRAALAGVWIEGVEPIDGESAAWARLFVPRAGEEVGPALGERLGSADRLISFVSDGRDAWAANAAALAAGADRCFVRPRPGAHDPVEPIAVFHRRQLAEQGLGYEPIDPPLRRNVDGPVVLHPGSGGEGKCWPVERWEALAEHLEAIGRPVWMVLGEAELERWAEPTRRRWADRFDVRTPASPIALGRVVAGAGVFVGNDAGPTHLAAQVGVPTVALFGPTDPTVWGPRGPAVRMVAPPRPMAMTWLDVAPVAEAVARG